MRWVGVIVVVMLFGAFAYYFFYREEPTRLDSPQGVAKAYIKAAQEGDQAQIRVLCTAAAVQEALTIAPQVSQMTSSGYLAFQAMKADPPRKGLSLMAGGRLLGIELIEDNGQWKIVHIGLTVM
jgi:hypothetical protein